MDGIIESKDLLTRLLGPAAAECIDCEISGLGGMCKVNLSRVLFHAWELLGSKVDNPGCVNPRVLKAVIDDGSFAENLIAQRYLGGVLASSRTETGSDDRGILLAREIGQMSSHEMKLHHVAYFLLSRLRGAQHLNLNDKRDMRHHRIFIASSLLDRTLKGAEPTTWKPIAREITACFERRGLGTILLNPDLHRDGYRGYAYETDGVVFTPSYWGARLFFWIHGQPGLDPTQTIWHSIDWQNVLETRPRDEEAGYVRDLTHLPGSLDLTWAPPSDPER